MKRSFKRCRDRPRVRNVVPDILALVDSRDQQIRFPGENGIHREMDTIRWCSVHCKNIFFDSLDAKGTMEGQGMSNRAFFTIRGDDGNLSESSESLCQNEDSF